MIVDSYEVRRLNQEKRRENSRESAAKYKAQADADAQNGWNIFLSKHSGAKAVRDGIVFFDCIANRDMIELLLDVEEMAVTAETIEWAWSECRSRLAKFPTQKYERKANINESRILPQQRSFGPPPLALPYTQEEILSWSKERLKQEVSKSQRHLEAVNRILARQN